MQFTQPADRHGAAEYPRRAPRTQARKRLRLEAHRGCIAGERQQIEDIRLDVIEIDRLASAAPLLGPACAGGQSAQRFDLLQGGAARVELIADLEQPHAVLLSAQILTAR